jgi:hypothetical protein
LKRRKINEEDARLDIETIIATIPPQQRSIVCGDFNTRTGTLSPNVKDQPTARLSIDLRRCPRAPWLIELCEMHNLYITNGLQPGPRAEYTCKHNKGHSVIDYVLSTEAHTPIHIDSVVLSNIADHSLLYTHIPINYTGQHSYTHTHQHTTTHPNQHSQPHQPPTNQPTQTIYKWIEGEDIGEYSASARKWKLHTESEGFIDAFN